MVIRQFAPGILVTLITAKVRFDRVVQQATVRRADGERDGYRKRGEGTNAARHDQVMQGSVEAALGALSAEQAQADGEKTVAAQGGVGRGSAGWFAGFRGQHVG